MDVRGTSIKKKKKGFVVEVGTMEKNNCKAIYISVSRYYTRCNLEDVNDIERFNNRLYTKVKKECQNLIGLVPDIEKVLVDLSLPDKYAPRSFIRLEVTLLGNGRKVLNWNKISLDGLIVGDILISVLNKIPEFSFE